GGGVRTPNHEGEVRENEWYERAGPGARGFLAVWKMARREPDVDRWLKGKPAEPILRRVRDVILWADDRVTEYLKYGTVQFACKGDFANFVHHNEKTVTLMFNRGAKLQG